MSFISDVRVALAFLSRLAPARAESEKAMAASLKAYPLAGLAIGLVALTPVWFGAFGGRPLLQAAVVLAVAAFVTRGLHWDGLADVADAWGSGARGERFWQVLKDSRAGAFGVMGCSLAVLLQAAALAETLGDGAAGVALFGFVFGRFLAVGLAHLAAHRGQSLARPGLGRFCLDGAAPGPTLFAAGQTLLAGLLFCPPAVLVWTAGLAAAGVWTLLRLARAQGGLNGDFLGSAIIWGEAAVWLSWSLAN